MQKLIGFGDSRTSNIVARIADEEVAHVAVGVHWFVSVCQKMGHAPCSTFKGLVAHQTYDRVHKFHFKGYSLFIQNFILSNHADLLKEYNVELKGPFNYSARDEAGIPRDW